MDRGSKGPGPLIEIMPPTAAKKKKNIVLFIGLVTFIGFLSHTTAKAKAKQNQSHKKKAKEDL